MKAFYCLSLLYSLASAVALEPAAVACPAQYQAKLSKCATPSPFCSSLLQQTAGRNYTLTLYTTAKETSTSVHTKTRGTTVFLTSTVYLTTSYKTTTSTTSVSTQTVTFPSATGSPTCYVQTIGETSGPMVVAVKTPTSCGFRAGQTALASSACSCFIDKKTTVTLTSVRTVTTKGTPTVILTHFQTFTTTSTVTTTTASTTSTVTLSPCPTPDRSCNNAGLQWAYYAAVGGNGYPSNSASFDPALYKNATYVINGTTSLVDVPTTDGTGTGMFYGKGPEPESAFFMNHRGYFVPPQTGNYTITLNYVDDAAYVWIGPLAYKGWNNTNWVAYSNWDVGPPTVQIALTKMVYYPFRVAMGQGGGAGGLMMTLVAPDGETVQSSVSSLIGSPYFVSFGCNGTVAPKYPPFGAES